MRLVAVLPVMLVVWSGEVRRAEPRGGVEREVLPTTISGVVFDSLTMRGLAGATVQMADANGGAWSRTVTSDGAGGFSITDVPAGTFVLGFFHSKLDSLALGSQMLRVDVRTEQPVQVRLAIPSASSIVRSLCGPKAVTDSTGLLIGYLRGADNSMPRPSGTLSVRWAEIIIERNSIQRATPTVNASTGATGLFAICGLPVGTPLLMHAASATDSSGSFELTVPPTGLLHRDVFVAPLSRTKVAVADSAPAVDLLRGTGRLRGQVVGATGRPIANARVMVWGTGVEATTNSDGAFSLTQLPAGTHTLEVRAVGFSPAQRVVDIVQGAGGATEVELANLGITLDTVRITGQRVYLSERLADFDRRLKMRTGTGHLIDETEIERRNPLVLTDLLRTVPGIQVLPGKRSDYDVFMRGGLAILGSGLCRPSIYVDGARIENDELFPFNSMVPISEIRALEVYTHASLVPVELRTLNGCGAIVVWTGARRRS